MAPVTPISGASVSQASSVGPRSPQTVHIVGLPSTQNISVGGSSTQKLVTASISTIRNTHLPGSTSTRKLSTGALTTTRATYSAGRSSTSKPAVVGTSTLQSTPPSRPVTNYVGPTTTQRVPGVIGQSPGGTHPNYSTHLPPISQGQHGTTSGGNESANTAPIIAGVLVPLILIGVGALIFYVWYRRKYPVRMLGRDFNRFSNPAYNKRASTLTLVRNDGRTEWDTLSRRNPDLSVVNEDDLDGIENQAFEYEKDENNGDGSAEKRVEVDIVTSSTDRKEKEDQTEMIPNIGISRDRPKTKKAVLVKTSTMEDLENGFELVTESDLGQRTESEVSSGNDSTETHTISLTFSETFDERHKEGQIHLDMGEEKVQQLDVNGREINGSENDNISAASIMDGIVGRSEPEDKDQTMNDNELNKKDLGSQNNESFEVIFDDQLSTSTESKKQTDSENDVNTTQLPAELPLEEKITKVNSDNVVESDDLKSFETINNSDSDVIEISNRSSINEINEQSNEANGDVKQQDNGVPLEMNGNATAVNATAVESVDEHSGASLSNAIKAESNADQIAFESFRDDCSFEILSDSEKIEFVDVNRRQDIDKYQDDMTQNEINVFEKEKTEILEKQKTLEKNNYLEAVPSVDIENSNSDGLVDEPDSQKAFVQRKLPSLNLSNENIVLDSIPQTPTVLVQESFILENESPLPVYLDSTNMSPGRGRRAFTLNDIISKQNSDDGVRSEFSLPKGKDNISKSSPVISELKTPKIQSFERGHFEFDNKNDYGKDVTEDSAKDSLDLTSNNTLIKASEIYPDKNEEEKHVSNAQEIHETVKINDIKDSVSGFDAFDSIGLEKSSYAQKDAPVENDELFTSLNSDSSELGREINNDFNLCTSTESNTFNDILTDPFNVILAGVKSDETLDHEKRHSLDKDYNGDKLDSLNLFTANFTSDKTFESAPSQTKNKVNGNNEITSEDILDEDNPFFSSFPQSSTPTASLIAESRTDSNEDPKKKKVLPQAFDFEGLGDNDNDSSTSEASSDTSEVQVINYTTSVETFDEHNKSLGAFKTEAFGTTDPIEQKSITTQHTGDSFADDDMFSLTRSTDSSTALSWEILSRENSLDSRSNDHFDIPNNEQNAPELLDFSVNKNQDNESKIVAETARIFDFIPDMSKQSASNNTSVGSSGTAEVSWEIVNEEGDNSEC